MAARGTIDFVGYHLPALPSGSYTITAGQAVHTVSSDAIPLTTFDDQTRHIFVGGPRFTLDAADVVGCFPPPGSLGDHSAVLPHILIEPSTTPWQRAALVTPASQPGAPGGPPLDAATQQQIRTTPWLALLVLDADEAPAPIVTDVAGLTSGPASFPAPAHEPGLAGTEKVTVIDLEWSLLQRLLPTPAELPYLAHVREYLDDNGPRETAVVLANRLPRPGGSTVVHLVSLEHGIVRQASGDWDYDAAHSGPADLVRLVSLSSWSFACTGQQHTFHGLAEHLDRSPATLKLPEEEAVPAARVTIGAGGWIIALGRSGSIRCQIQGNVPVVPDPIRPGMQFTGNPANYLEIDDPFGDPMANTGFTIAAWLRPDRVNDGSPYGILGRYESGMPAPSLTLTEAHSGLAYDSYDRDGSRYDDLQANFFPAAGEWVHLTWIKDGHQYRFYRNGIRFGTAPAPAFVINPASNYWIGRADTGWAGLLADVRIYDQVLDDKAVRRLPDLDPVAEPELIAPLIDRGLVPLGHDLRTGAATVSWYRGPLSGPGPAPAAGAGSEHPDGLLEYHPAVGMFDVSYAAARELGRELALRDTKRSGELHRWKQARRRHGHRQAQATADPHLFDPGQPPPPLPADVAVRFQELARLHEVPFAYLVPDERLLPPESLRFVRLDRAWADRLIEGVAAVGGQLPGGDAALLSPAVLAPESGPVTGVLLRSELVSSWPDLVLNAYDVAADGENEISAEPLPVLRLDQPAAGVLLCLFGGETVTLDIHLAPEQIHFGFLADTGPSGEAVFTKRVRAAPGAPAGTQVSPVPMRPAPASPAPASSVRGGTVDVGELVIKLGTALGRTLDGAGFALEMIEGVPRVRFVAS